MMLDVIDDGSMMGICPSGMQGLVCGRKSGYVPWKISVVPGREKEVLTIALQSCLRSLLPGVQYHVGSNSVRILPVYGQVAPFVD